MTIPRPVSYTHLRAHETRHELVCRLLLEKKKRVSPSSLIAFLRPYEDSLPPLSYRCFCWYVSTTCRPWIQAGEEVTVSGPALNRAPRSSIRTGEPSRP